MPSVNNQNDKFEQLQKMMNQQVLLDIIKEKMPYGKYKGWQICNLPEPYLSWYHAKGFPVGKIGMLLSTIYEIKLNGLEYLLTPLKNR